MSTEICTDAVKNPRWHRGFRHLRSLGTSGQLKAETGRVNSCCLIDSLKAANLLRKALQYKATKYFSHASMA